MARKEVREVDIGDKLLLTTREVQALTGIGRTNCLRLIKESGCYLCVGRKILVKRAMFEQWCKERVS